MNTQHVTHQPSPRGLVPVERRLTASTSAFCDCRLSLRESNASFAERKATLNPSVIVAVLLILFVTAFFVNDVSATEPSGAKRPNFLIVLCDDLGYGDLACYGHPRIKSPNIDHFVTESMKLTNCYAAASNCSPARTGLMTGRTPHRVGIHNWIPTYSPMHVRRSEITIATLLRNAGYNTCQVGKWHLNGMFNLPPQPQPSDHGFDHWFATQNNALPTHHNPDNFARNGKWVGKLEGYSAHLVAAEAIDWLKNKRDKSKPFFLYTCFHEPHEPINSDPKYKSLYEAPEGSTLPNHHGNVTQMDDAFGRLMRTVDELKLRDNTLVVFTSDNGPAITGRHPHGSAGPLRDKKGYMYEGGIRVPGIIRWPGHTKPGQVSDEPVCGVDLLPTLCEIAGIPVPQDRAIDGTSFLPIFDDKPIQRKTPLYWQFNAARGKPKVCMRIGDWKILATLTGETIKPYGDIRVHDQQNLRTAELDSFELYNLNADIAEATERSQQEPQRLKAMSQQLRKMYREIRGESPVWPAWKWPRYEGKRIQAYYRAQAKIQQQN